ncbi:hypothetical protein [Candidatus Uabimicrobium sp. HlEnr_7]|uniref:hypothetical protein n=1 Tax=Candidatus Uabimicrobium helgolandensis TaxID=3095367 RepID=UPI003555E33F
MDRHLTLFCCVVIVPSLLGVIITFAWRKSLRSDVAGHVFAMWFVFLWAYCGFMYPLLHEDDNKRTVLIQGYFICVLIYITYVFWKNWRFSKTTN